MTGEAPAAVRVAAPAKLNLYLHVVGRRGDGYHLLDSLVAFADIGDIVTAAPAERLSLTIDGPFAAPLRADEEENLVARAARLLAVASGVPARAALHLEKNLPVASGIGGGSSDAAAALKALAALWRLDLAPGRLAEIGARLGADVPVCLAGRTAWLGGIGGDVRPGPSLPPVALVLANPGVALATPAVFKARQGPFSPLARFAETPCDAAHLAALLAERRNDLAAPAIGLVPEISSVLARLAACPGALLARMSGSGATCFALFADDGAAADAAARLTAEQPLWWVAAGRLIP